MALLSVDLGSIEEVVVRRCLRLLSAEDLVITLDRTRWASTPPDIYALVLNAITINNDAAQL